jgi:hypothetical protein
MAEIGQHLTSRPICAGFIRSIGLQLERSSTTRSRSCGRRQKAKRPSLLATRCSWPQASNTTTRGLGDDLALWRYGGYSMKGRVERRWCSP